MQFLGGDSFLGVEAHQVEDYALEDVRVFGVGGPGCFLIEERLLGELSVLYVVGFVHSLQDACAEDGGADCEHLGVWVFVVVEDSLLQFSHVLRGQYSLESSIPVIQGPVVG